MGGILIRQFARTRSFSGLSDHTKCDANGIVLSSIWRKACRSLKVVFSAVIFSALTLGNSSNAQDARIVESFGAHCNDIYFGSDGSGLGGCIDFAARFSNDWYVALGAFQSGPEASQGNAAFNSDPLDDRGRVVLRFGKTIKTDEFHATTTLRLGGEGGFVDDFIQDVRSDLHDIFGLGTRPQRGDVGLRGIIGVSGHAWQNYELGSASGFKALFSPYVHGSLGTENIEGGAGFLLGFQPSSAEKPLPFVEPQNGAYAPFFGDDGIGVFVAARGVALETIYGDLEEGLLGEVGVVGQYTFTEHLLTTISASCTNDAYEGALEPDCKATFRIGVLY
ncbi:MAG: hypothetical protein AAGF54_01935 [Pseudomonadota bacterium]